VTLPSKEIKSERSCSMEHYPTVIGGKVYPKETKQNHQRKKIYTQDGKSLQK